MSKKEKRNSVKIIIILLAIVLTCFIGYYLYDNYIVVKTTINKNDLKLQKISKEKVYKLSMIMAGDALIHDGVYYDAYKSDGTYDFKKQLKLIKPIVSKHDLAFYNQEAILGGTDIGLSSYPRFNSPYEFGDAMVDAGFNLVSLANNHTLDRGKIAIINSSNYWKQHKNVLTAGSYASKVESEVYTIKKKNNITYSLLAYTTLTNGLSVPVDKEYLVNVYNEDKAKQDIANLRDKVDILIVSMHWGAEYTHNPTEQEINIANFLASQDVDIVIGHHPHVIQPVTWINDTLVFYSLGNLISAQEKLGDYQRLVGLMSSLNITKTEKGNTKTIKIDNVKNELIYTYYNSRWRDYKVIPFSKMNTNYNANYLHLYNKYSEVVKRLDANMFVVPLKNR